jgi:hypothetical protein
MGRNFTAAMNEFHIKVDTSPFQVN